MIIILQVINALSIANKRLNFSHGDLHLENILIQSLNEEKIIKIKQTFVSTYLIPKIIDYGYSSFYLNEEINLNYKFWKHNTLRQDTIEVQKETLSITLRKGIKENNIHINDCHESCETELYQFYPNIKKYSEFPTGTFDLVFCSNVLNHVLEKDLNKVVKQLYDLTNKAVIINIHFPGFNKIIGQRTPEERSNLILRHNVKGIILVILCGVFLGYILREFIFRYKNCFIK